MNRGDVLSAFIRQLTEFFGATHPIRLGVAVCLGMTCSAALKISVPIFHSEAIATAADLSPIYYMALWGAVLFLPLAIGWRGAPDNAVNVARTLRLWMAEAKLDQQEIKLTWRILIQKYVDAAQPDLSNLATARLLFDQAEAEVKQLRAPPED
jgi:hypothetical protein